MHLLNDFWGMTNYGAIETGTVHTGERTTGAGVSSHRVLIGVAIAIVLMLAALGYLIYGPAWGLAKGHDHWLESRPQSYDMTVRVECFCSFSGTWDVSVDGDAVEVVFPEHAEEKIWKDGTIPLPTVDTLYRIALRNANSSPWPSPWSRPVTTYRVDAMGVPREVLVDRWGAIDEEFGWSIDRFEANPVR